MSKLEILTVSFVVGEQFDINEQFKYCFGIMARPMLENPAK
jgi:hypothetical protein